jgi:hypothetical protein
MSARFPTTAQKVTPWAAAREQQQRMTLFPVMVPDTSALAWDEPPPENAKPETTKQQIKRWRRKHELMEG